MNIYTTGVLFDENNRIIKKQGQQSDRILSTLPDQFGNEGKLLTTDGTNPSWTNAPTGTLPIQTNNQGKILTTDGSTASWTSPPSSLPTQTGQSGKLLTTDGNTASWTSPPSSLPTQTGQSGKLLTTDGNTASWTSPPSSLPTQTGHSGKLLTTDGTNISWANVPFNPTLITSSNISGFATSLGSYPKIVPLLYSYELTPGIYHIKLQNLNTQYNQAVYGQLILTPTNFTPVYNTATPPVITSYTCDSQDDWIVDAIYASPSNSPNIMINATVCVLNNNIYNFGLYLEHNFSESKVLWQSDSTIYIYKLI